MATTPRSGKKAPTEAPAPLVLEAATAAASTAVPSPAAAATTPVADERRRLHDEAMELCRRNVEKAKKDKSGRVYRIYAVRNQKLSNLILPSSSPSRGLRATASCHSQ